MTFFPLKLLSTAIFKFLIYYFVNFTNCDILFWQCSYVATKSLIQPCILFSHWVYKSGVIYIYILYQNLISLYSFTYSLVLFVQLVFISVLFVFLFSCSCFRFKIVLLYYFNLIIIQLSSGCIQW